MKRYSGIAIIIAIIFTIAISSVHVMAYAQTLGGSTYAQSVFGTPIGGKVSSIFYCLCSGTWQVTLAGPTYGTYDYVPFTQKYLYHNIPFASHILGLVRPGARCLIPAGLSCTVKASRGVITETVGSSLLR